MSDRTDRVFTTEFKEASRVAAGSWPAVFSAGGRAGVRRKYYTTGAAYRTCRAWTAIVRRLMGWTPPDGIDVPR